MNLRQNFSLARITEWVQRTLSGMRLSVLELVFLLSALVFTGIVIFFYLSRVQPLKNEIVTLREREVELQGRIDRLKTDEKKRSEQASNAGKILDSLSRFEGFLKPDERGMTQIINEIDSLGSSHKVIIGDASYKVDQSDAETDEEGNPKQESASKDKKPKIYPALGIDTTVIGDYPNLRKFLFDLERSKQFLIINSVAFQGEADNMRRALPKGSNVQVQLSSPDAIPVSLKIELDTYFQKPVARNQ